MQPLLGGPRADLTEAEVTEALAAVPGLNPRWGVDVVDAALGLLRPLDRTESSEGDWQAGALGAGLAVAGGDLVLAGRG